MPLIHFLCSKCAYGANYFYRNVKEIPSLVECEKCGDKMKRQLKGPSSTSVITVDNGVQARATEVNLEIVEDIKARSTKDFKKD